MISGDIDDTHMQALLLHGVRVLVLLVLRGLLCQVVEVFIESGANLLHHRITFSETSRHMCVCVSFPFILDIKFVGHTSRGHTGGRSHKIFHPPSFCGACLNVSREKDSAIPVPRRP